MRWITKTAGLVVVLLVGCAPSGPGTQARGPDAARPAAPAAPRILTAAINEDPKNFWEGINAGGGGGGRELGHMVNQYLVAIGPDGTPTPRLLVELPSVEKGTWKVAPDGTMEVTYRLRPGVTWHDGTPFTADDVLFSREVGRDPGIANSNQGAHRLIDGMTALDQYTVVASWTQTYAFADRLEHREFMPLPKHILEGAYRESKETLTAQPYFSNEYIGLGPFKVTSWEHGSALEMVANDQYFLGRPKIDRIRVMFIPDPNTAFANLRAGAVNVFLPTGGPDYDQLLPLGEEWKASGKGEIVIETIRWEFAEAQKSQAAQPADLRDARMRQALLMGINRQDMARNLLGEQGMVAHSWVHPTFSYYPQVKDAIVEYPYDPRRATALLGELGWTPGPDGMLQKGGARLQFNLRFESDSEKQGAILQQDWKAIGADVQLEFLSNVELRDAERRVSFTGLYLNTNPMGGASAVRRFAGDQIPTAANRFSGTNRGAFTSTEWDEVGLKLRTALDDSKRIELERDLLKVFSVELPALPIHYQLQSVPVSGLKGFRPVTGTAHTGNIMHTTNVHEWEM
ncbi:MAG: hypothetical protein HW416_2220 [Chloroflexi bacterium]|nr:hypothetical protein [Chloroflexota bacterium]